MTVNQLVAQNRIKDALSLLPDDTTSLMLKGRYSRLQKEVSLGVISTEAANLENSRIVAAILSIAGNSNDSQPISYQSPIAYQPSTPKQLTPSQIRAILERKNIGEAETSELIAACSQVLDFFKSNLSEDDYLELCADGEMAFRKFSARPKDEDRKFSLIEAIGRMLPDYENFAETSNTETVLETLYNRASEAKTLETFKPYFEAVLRKFPVLANWKAEFEVDEIEHLDLIRNATPLSKKMFEKQLCERWLNKVGKR